MTFSRRSSLGAPRRLVCAVALAAGLATPTIARADGAPPNRVSEVRALAAPQSTEIVVVGTASPKFSARLADKRRLIIDISDTQVEGAPAPITERVGLVAGVSTQSFKTDTGSTTRVTISLTEEASFRVRADGTNLRVSLSKGDASTGPVRLGAPTPAAPRAPGDRVRDVRYSRAGGVDRVTIEVGEDARVSEGATGGGKARLDLRGAKVPKELERTLDVGAYGGLVKSVSTFHTDAGVVVEVERQDGAVGVVSREGSAVVWTFSSKARGATSAETGVALDGGVARKTRTVAREEAVSGVPKIETGISADDIAAPDAAGFVSAPLGQARGAADTVDGRRRRYTGARVDIDLKDADVHNVLRILADVGHVNIVTADNVKGDVTLRLRNVPWDQALDVVLQAKSLGMVRTGNMLRVAPLADLEKEREMLIQKRKQELDLAPLETRLIPVSYSSATDIAARAKELLSARGSLSVDERTNMLIARDVPGNLNQVEELIRSLDTQTPQVLIEARIVEATSRYLRDVGIQWGGDATFSPATGNPTGLAFPNSIGLVGGASDAQTPTAGLSPFQRNVQNPNFAVNLPAAAGTGTGGALGLTFGSINNAFNLGLRLSAAESSGMLRIVSSPRILTLDNRQARIAQGTLIPYSQISAQGVQTNFQEAKLQLDVKPHVTADGSISMHVKINRDEPDFNQTSARGDPTILKREAETDLLIMDGHTAVIGGIFTRNTGRNLDQVPFFGDIPLLGLLFQRRRASDSRGELVIFLTPRIVNRAEALGKLPDPHRAAEHGRAERQAPRRLAVHVDEHLRPRVDGLRLDDRAARHLHRARGEVGAGVDLVRQRQALEPRKIAHRDDVEQAVGRIGVGRDLHPAAEVPAVADREVEHRALLEDGPVDAHAHRLVAVAEPRARGAEEVRRLAAEPLRRLVDHPVGDASDAEARDVDERARDRRAVVVDELQPPEIVGDGGPPARARDRRREAVDAERLAEISARPGGHDEQVRALDRAAVVAEVALRGLVERAVAAHHRDHLDALRVRALHQAPGVARALGLGDVAREIQARELAAHLGEQALGAPSARARVEDDADVGWFHRGRAGG